jgi:hypothetical protein
MSLMSSHSMLLRSLACVLGTCHNCGRSLAEAGVSLSAPGLRHDCWRWNSGFMFQFHRSTQ